MFFGQQLLIFICLESMNVTSCKLTKEKINAFNHRYRFYTYTFLTKSAKTKVGIALLI